MFSRPSERTSLINRLFKHRSRRLASRVRRQAPQVRPAERLEERRLLAFDLVAAFASSDEAFFTAGVTVGQAMLNEAPQQVTLRFSPGTRIDTSTLGSITVLRPGADGVFGTADDQPLDLGRSIGYVGIGDAPNENEVVIRFAETLPDGAYRIDVGAGLGSSNNGAVRPTRVDVRLDLGAFVMAVVPQPITRVGSGLVQARNTIAIHFNANDPLNQASAENPTLYRLVEVDAAGDDTGTPLAPTSVTYNPTTGTAVLTFAGELPNDRLYRIEIGGDAVVLPTPPEVEAAGNNSSFVAAQNVVLTNAGLTITGAISPRPFVTTPAGILLQPSPLGTRDEPGHRDHPFIDGFQHGEQFTTIGPAGPILTRAYNFQDYIGNDPQGNPLFNVITDAQKQRAREILELYSLYSGIRFIETENLGLTIATGDLRALDPFVTPDVNGLGGGDAAYMTSSRDWGESEYGGGWFNVAMHEIGHALGLWHSFDVPSIMDYGRAGRNPIENVFPFDYDIGHVRQLLPINGADVDIYRFNLAEQGRLTAETFVARPGEPIRSTLDSVLTLFRETTVDGRTTRELIARNDDYYGRDSFVGLDLEPGDYFIAVSSTGNTAFNPEVADSGFGGRTQGAYELRLGFTPSAQELNTIVDRNETPIDGNRDGTPGGLFRFWFRTAAQSDTIYVDKANPVAGLGSLGNPFKTVSAAIAAAQADPSKRIIRIAGNTAGPGGTPLPYEIGTRLTGQPLPDGTSLTVPGGVTLMIEAGAVFKLRSAIVDVGSSSQLVSRARAALQVLGTPGSKVVFTSWHDDSIGGDSDGVGPALDGGQWGGIVLREDSDAGSRRAFVNVIAGADIRYGGGQVVVDGKLEEFSPIQIESTRPTIIFNEVTGSSGTAIAATPNSFLDTGERIGPEMRGNTLVGNSINGLFLKIDTEFGVPLERLTVPARFTSTDIVYVIAENLVIEGGVGGYLGTGTDVIARATGRLTIDPGVIVKLQKSRIELERGLGRLYAEGLPNRQVIFTSIEDDRYGAAGTFATNGSLVGEPLPGDWGGIVLNAGSAASIDHAYIAYGGGATPIEGRFDRFNVIEVHQGDLRVANSRIERNDGGLSATTRNARGTNAGATIFVRGSQPVIVGNDFRDNIGAVVSINANSLSDVNRADPGRSTGGVGRFSAFDANLGPLVGGNLITPNDRSRDVERGFTIDLEFVPGVTPAIIAAAEAAARRWQAVIVGDLVDVNDPVRGLIDDVVIIVQAGLLGNNPSDGPGGVAGNAGLRQSRPAGSPNQFLPYVSAVGIDMDDVDSPQLADIMIHEFGHALGFAMINSSLGQTEGSRFLGENALREYRRLNPGAEFAPLDGPGGHWDELTFGFEVMTPIANPGLNPLSRITVGAFEDMGYTVDYAAADPYGLPADGFVPTRTFLGMEVRGEEITVESVWDDTDIVHILRGEVIVENFHSMTGLRLLSSPDASLVVKLDGPNAGFTAAGYPADINYRIGGTVQIVGQPGRPVVLTSVKDDSLGAGFDPLGRVVRDTNNDGDVSVAAAGDWRSLQFLPYSNDRNVAIFVEAESAMRWDRLRQEERGDTNAQIQDAQSLGVLAPNFATGTNSWESDQEKSGDEYRRLGFEVHGFIAPDDPTDVDVYSFLGYAGSEVWIDIDKTASSLDSMVEVLDASGEVIASSVDAQTDGSLSAAIVGQGLPLERDIWRAGDHYTLNPKDPGMRLILPGTVGQQARYFVRVRSQPAYEAGTTLAGFETAVMAPPTAGATSGRYELRIRLRQLDEKPGSTVQFADIRYAAIGIDVQGLPRNSLLLGEIGENPTDNNESLADAQDIGNLLESDRATLSIAGQIASARDVDWYAFTVEVTPVGGSMWSTVFDLDYGAGFRGDLTLAVFDPAGRLIYVGRDSNVEDDQPDALQGTDFDDIGRGSISPLDPFIGSVTLLAEGRYSVAVFSNERLPEVLSATFQTGSTNTLVRLEPINSIDRLVEDRIGGGPSQIIDTTNLGAHVTPFTLADVTLFVSNGGGLFTFDAISGGLETTIQTTYAGLALGDLDMRTDGRLFAYAGVAADPTTAGRLLELDTGTGGIRFDGDDNVTNVAAGTDDNRQTTTNSVTALAFRRTGVGAYADLWYVVQDGGTSKLYRAESGGTAAGNPTANAFGAAGANFGYRGRIVVDLDANGRYDGAGEQPLVTGLQFADDSGGVLFGVTADGKLLSLQPATSNPDLTDLGLVTVATIVADFSSDLADIGAAGFTALAAAPRNLYGGELQGRFFALTNTGRLALLNPAGVSAASDAGQFGLLERSGDVGGSIYVQGETVGEVVAQAGTLGVATDDGTRLATETVGSYGGGITRTASSAALERQTTAYVSGTLTSIPVTPSARQFDRLVVAGTGSLTAGQSSVTGLGTATIGQLFVGMLVNGAGVPAGTRIQSISGSTVTLSAPATASGANVALEFSVPRLLLDSVRPVVAQMLAGGDGIPWGTTVLQVGQEGAQSWVALSAEPAAFSDGDPVAFYRRIANITRNSDGSPNLVVQPSIFADLAVGMPITSTGLTTETRITAIDAATNTITLSQSLSAGPVTLSIYGVTTFFGIAPAAGMVVLGNGVPFNTIGQADGSLSKPIGEVTGELARAFSPLVITDAPTTIGSPSVTLAAAIRGQLAVGMPVVGVGITPGTTVTAITATGITLSRPATATQATATLRFLGLGSLATSDTTLELTSVAGVTVDMLVEGTTLGWGTTVTAVDPATRTITLSDPVAIPNPSLTLRFYGLVAGNLAGTASDFTVTLPGGVTGLLPGMVVTGGGLTVNTVVEQVDPVAGTVRLSRIVPPGPPSVFSFYGVTTIAGIGGLQDGWLITGPGIPYDTRIVVAGGTTSPSRPVAQFADRTLSAFGPELTATVTLTAGNAGIAGLTPPQLALLATGMTAVGEGVPPNTTITVAGGVVTLSQPATLTGSSSVLFLDTESFARDPRVIAVDSTAGLTTGMLVVGPGIPWGTVVAAVGATQVMVDRNLESPQAGVALDFFTSAGAARTGTAAGVTVDLPGGTAGVAAGMWVTGGGLTLPTRVLTVDFGNQRVTLDRAPAAGAVTLSFYGVRRIEVADATGIQTGMLAFGVGVPLGTRVAGVVGTTITLDQTVGEVTTGRMDFIASLNRTATRITGVSNEVTINDASGLRIGMLLFGTGIPPHTAVTNIIGQTLTLSAEVTFPTSTAARFVQPDAAFAADANAGFALVEVAGGFADVAAASVRGLRPGMLVLGAGIREGTRVNSVTVTGGVATVTLSQLALGDGGLALRFIDGRTVRVARTPATLELLPGMSVTPTPPAAAGATIAALDFAAPGGEVVVVMSAPAQTTTAATQLVFRTAAAASGNIDGRIIDVALPTSFEGLTGDLLVFGIGILDGTTVVAVNQLADTITLSQPATRAVAANEIRLVRADQTKLSSTTVALPLDQITVNNTTGLAVGMLVFAPDVPRNTRITAIAGTTLTLSDERPVAAVTSGTAYFVQPDLAVDAQPPGGNPAVLSLAALTPAAFNAVHVGMLVFGEGLPANTRIVAVNRAARTLTLSAPAAAGVQRYSFVRDGRVVANVESLTNISVSDEVVGLGLAATDGLPAGTLVARVATNPADINDYGPRTIVLTQAAYRDELGKRLVFTTPGVTDSVVLGGLTSTAMLRPGMVVFADELELLAPVTIQSIDTLTSITLDAAVPLGTTLSDVIFVTQVSLDNPQVEAQATATAGSNVITMVATDAIRMGMLVVGTGIPYNTVVTGKTATDLTLSKPATGSVTDDYDFVNTSSVEYLADWSGATTLFNFSPVLAAGATGLAFSPLDINLWHPTTQRGTEAGHGINAAPDGTRAPAPGGTSLYFGLEQLTGAQYGGSTAWQQDLLANPAIGNNYNLPGGAYGSLTTNPFDLTGYDYTDKPTLYFNYWLQTENAAGTTANTLMRDSARVLVSIDAGLYWELVATNNPTRNNVLTSELPGHPSVSSALSLDPRQAVQQMYGTSQWRQARIDLGTWAGEADVRLRFDFSTAGTFDPNDPNQAGIVGQANATGDFGSPQRGQNNQFEGFYIDDILVGFAERGEMVTAAPVGQTGFYEINSPTSDFFSQQILSGPYQLEIRRGTVYVDDTFSIAQTFDTNDRLVPELGLSVLGEFQQGDRNALREQGQFFIQGNIISDTAQYGVRIDAGIRDPLTNAPIPGVPRNLPVLNNARLAPGAVVVNNVIVGSGTAGILFSGDPNTGNVPSAAVPFGRIVNNTIVGGQTRQGVGVEVTQNAGPTLLNNLFASLATAVSVDTSSRFDGAGNQRTVVGTSAYFDVGTQVLGVNQQFPLVLTGNPFVNPANRNYYLRQGSSAIDSALNSLQDRPEYVVVNSEIGIGQLPILAPEQDVYGQLRGDDPTQPSAPGLGANVFKDRGAIERVDYVAPFATLVVPEDDGPQDVNLTADTVRLEREDARNRRRFEIQLQDLAVGIDRATVSAGAFTLTRNGTVLQDGVDYIFFFVELTDRVVFEAPAAFQQGTYLISVARDLADGDLVNVVKDLAGNALRANRPDGTTQFTIELVDVPLAPMNLEGTSGDGQVSLTWVASPGVITQYEVEWAIDEFFVVNGTMQVTPPALNATIVSLTNGTPYWFRVRAVNAVGKSEWSNIAGPIVPLKALTLGLVTDTGRLPNDRVTNDRRVVIGGFVPSATWEYSTDAGVNWTSGSGTQFVLAEGVYPAGGVRVRQSLLGSVSAISQNVGSWTIDLTPPVAAGLALASGVTNPVSLNQALAGSGIVQVTGESTATISAVFSRNGVSLREKTRIGGGPITLTSGDLATLGDGFITVTATQVDLAGNPQLAQAATLQFTLDTTAPVPPVITGVVDDVLPVIGIVPNSGRTNDSTPTVQGVAEPSVTVTVLVNGTQRGTVTANGFGNWSLTLPTLLDGTYAITARATDAVGNASGLSSPYMITIDRVAPVAPMITGVTDDAEPVTGNVPNGGRTNDSTPTISGTAEAGSTVTVLLNGMAQAMTATADSGGSWSLTTTTQADGVYTITARASDAAGNTGVSSAAFTITIDLTPPTAPVITGVADDVPLVTGNVPSGGRTNDPTPTISGTAEAGSTVTVLLNTVMVLLNGETQAPTTAGGTGVWSLTTTALPDGTYSITTLATDAVGNTGVASAAHTITIDTVAPTLTALAAPAGTYRVGQSIPVTATLSEPVLGGGVVIIGLNTGASVTLTAVAGTTTATGTYTVQPGQSTSRLRATSMSLAVNPIADLAGNVMVSTTLPGDQDNFGDGTGVAVDGDVKVLPVPPHFGTSPLQVVDAGRSVTEIPVRFTTPVVGVNLAAFELLLDGRPVSLRDATLSGSGDNYVLRLPALRANPSGIYELVVRADTGIRAASNGTTMKQPGRIYWGKDRSVSSTTIESAGSVRLSYNAAGSLAANDTTITSAGGAVNYNSYIGWGWTARAAEVVGGVPSLAWQNSAGEIRFWRLNSGWAQVSADSMLAPDTREFWNAEVDFGIDFDGDGEIGRSLTVIENVGAVTLGYDADGKLLANDIPIESLGGPVNYHTFVGWGWTARAAEARGGVNTLVWQNTAGELQLWELSAGWVHQISRGDYAVGSAAFNAVEASFGMDFNGDGQVAPATTVIEQRGDVTLEYDGDGNLRANGILLNSFGGPVNYDTLRSWGWTARAADTVGGVNTVLWQNDAGQLQVWRMSSDWAHQSSEGDFTAGSPQYDTAEAIFGVDVNGDGRITIESAGATTLWYDVTGDLRANDTLVTSFGSPVNYDRYRGWGWEALAAESLPGVGETIVWRNLKTGGLQYWRLDPRWAHELSEGDDRPGSTGYNQAETAFLTDFDRNGIVGESFGGLPVEIESRGGVVLTRDGSGNLMANGVLVQSSGRAVNYFTYLGWGWTAVAADVVDGVNTIAWRNSAGELQLWELDGGWVHVRSRGNYAPGTGEFETARQALQIDL